MFNFTEVKNDFGILPDGIYSAKIDLAEFKESQKDGVKYLSLRFSITGPEYAGRKIFQIYNVFNKNDQARNIAMTEVKKILDAQGYDTSKLNKVSPDDLLAMITSGKEIMIGVSNRTDSFGEKNVIKKYSKKETASTPNLGKIPF